MIISNYIFWAALGSISWGFIIWWFKGRDYIAGYGWSKEDQATRRLGLFETLNAPLVYHPIEGLTPGEAGFLIDEKVDDHDVVAEILDLVAGGYIKLVPLGLYKRHFYKDYKFIQLKSDWTNLPPQHQLIMKLLFHQNEITYYSQLVGKVSSEFRAVKTAIAKSAYDKGLWINDPQETLFNIGVLWLAYLINLAIIFGEKAILVAIGVGGFLAILYTLYQRDRYRNQNEHLGKEILYFGGLVYVIIFLIVIVVDTVGSHFLTIFWLLIPVVVLAKLSTQMAPKSALGTYYYLQAVGLKDTLRRSQWREVKKEADLEFTDLFAYAVAFNIVRYISSDLQSLAHMSFEQKQLYELYQKFDKQVVDNWLAQNSSPSL